MSEPRSRNNKRARVDDEEATLEEDQDVRLCAALRGLLGGSKYVKQSELSREVLLSYAIQKGDVVPVTLFTVTVGPLAGDIFDVKMEEGQTAPSSFGSSFSRSKARLFPHRHSFYCPRVARLKMRASFQ